MGSVAVLPSGSGHPPGMGYPTRLRDQVEEYLVGLRFSHDAMTAGLEEVMRYSLLAGGKRLRPVLALATADVLGLEHRTVLPLAAALELIHTLSLIHDDLPGMDDDDVRRGRPASHTVHGEGLAILAGDALFAEAFALLVSELEGPPERVLHACRVVTRAVGTDGMAGGQYLDLARTARSAAQIVHLHNLKTGMLIGACIDGVVALASHPNRSVVSSLRRYGAELGLMFQVIDDLLDAEQDRGPGGSESVPLLPSHLADLCLARIRECLVEVPQDGSDLLAIAEFVRYRTS